MIRAWRFHDGVACESFEAEAALDALSTRHDQHVVWLDVDSPTNEQIHTLAGLLSLHHLSVEDLKNRGQRTKLERYDDHSHVVVRECRFDSSMPSHLYALEVDLVFGPGWVVSLREAGENGEAPAELDAAFLRFERQRREHGSTDEGFIVWAILDIIVDRYFGLADHIDDQLDLLEDTVFSDGVFTEMSQDAYTLRRSLLTFRRCVSPLREVLSVILRREIEDFSPNAIVHFQDVNDHVLRIMDLLETQRELLADLRDAQISIASNRMNRVMKATSSWGAILVMNTLIAGIYGMNFKHMPELGWFWGYPFALGLMAAITAAGIWIFKRRDWL